MVYQIKDISIVNHDVLQDYIFDKQGYLDQKTLNIS